MAETWPPALLDLTAWFQRCSGLWAHDTVNPLGVVRDDGVNSRLFQLATLSSSVGSDSHHDAVVEQRTARVALRDDRKTSRTGSNGNLRRPSSDKEQQ